MNTQHPEHNLSSPWKPCDVRGRFPDQVSPALFRNIGGALGTRLEPRSRVLLCGDYRLSTVVLKAAVSQGLLSTGVTVLDAGQIPTPVGYFAARQLQADAVLIVTASHNPASDNGLKLMIGALPPTPEELAAIRSSAASGNFRPGIGQLESVDLLPAYRQFILKRWRHLAPHRLPTLILDAGNGAWSELGPALFRALGFHPECIACHIDGSFPSRSPDCARTANLSALRTAVLHRQPSIGIAWDGDGDRVAFVDEDGQHVSTDEIAVLLARELLSEHAGASSAAHPTVVIDIKFSDLVRREVAARLAHPAIERSGHAFMRSRLISENALLGLDACGHYFFRELGPGDDGLFSALFLLSILERHQTKLSELRRAISPIFTTPELRIPAALVPFPLIASRLQAAFPNATLTSIDGVRFVQDEGVVLARESSTEPVASLRIEGADAARLQTLIANTLAALPELESLLKYQISPTRGTVTLTA